MAVAYNTKKCDCKLVEQNSGIAKVRFLHVIILFCQKGRNLKLWRASRYFKGTSKPAQTKRTLNKILRFEGSGLWLRRREKGYLFTELTISVTIELFAYTALQGLFHFSLHPQKVQQAWDESGLRFMKGPENHTEEYAFLSHDADNDLGKRWQRVGTRMENDEDPWPKTQSNNAARIQPWLLY